MIFDRPEVVDFGALGGPGRPGNPPKRWGAKPPTFLEGFPAAPGRPDPPKSTISGRSQNRILKTQARVSPFKGPRGPLKGSRGPFKGPRGPVKGPRGPFTGPRGP